jgi:hypothetical protein
MAETETFKKWHRIEIARRTGALAEVERRVDRAMNPKNLRVDVQEGGRWVPEKEAEEVRNDGAE